MTTSLDLDTSLAALNAAGAVCRRERQLRSDLASLIARPRDPEAWARVRANVRPEAELAMRTDLHLLEVVAKNGSAGVVMGGSPRTSSTEEGTTCE